LNTPRKEHADGRVWTFAREPLRATASRARRALDQAEPALLKGLERNGFCGAFRHVHGAAVRELSWQCPRWGGGYRLDHLVVSQQIAMSDIGYLHDWRLEGLSDHSPLLARIEWPIGGYSGSASG
jgi:endonuclease/exonuclease/phosphatase family metal-dependent hydrolase